MTASPFNYKSLTPLDQRVSEFEKTARYTVKKLDQTLKEIEDCKVKNSDISIEHLKQSIAPDAALILSQGDTLILETHGKSPELLERLNIIQLALRDKYKDVQNCNINNKNAIDPNLLMKEDSVNPDNQYLLKEKVFKDKKFPVDLLRSPPQSIVLNDLVKKVLKRVNDLTAKPVDLNVEEELNRRILEIGVSHFFSFKHHK